MDSLLIDHLVIRVLVLSMERSKIELLEVLSKTF